MKYLIKRDIDKVTFQMVIEAEGDFEDDALRDLYHNGSIIALGETPKGLAELVLATSPPDGRRR